MDKYGKVFNTISNQEIVDIKYSHDDKMLIGLFDSTAPCRLVFVNSTNGDLMKYVAVSDAIPLYVPSPL